MRHNYILGIDPSGNFHEGKGITGWCLYCRDTREVVLVGEVRAKDSDSQVEHWHAHLTLINNIVADVCGDGNVAISMEDYLLYAHEVKSQINSKVETPQLIGVIKMHCYLNNIPLYMRNASEVKKRWADRILVHESILRTDGEHYKLINGNKVLSGHIRDSIRHAMHADRYEIKEVIK